MLTESSTTFHHLLSKCEGIATKDEMRDAANSYKQAPGKKSMPRQLQPTNMAEVMLRNMLDRAQTCAQAIAYANPDVRTLTCSLYDTQGQYLGSQTFGVHGEATASRLHFSKLTPHIAADFRLQLQLQPVSPEQVRASVEITVSAKLKPPTRGRKPQ